MKKRGMLITFEGAEGSGKSTQIELLRQFLTSKGLNVLLVREPGGVRISERIREILLDSGNKEMGSECETLLYMAARAQLVAEVIEPALSSGKIVLCDRYLDSTVAYQGFGNGVDIDQIRAIGLFATKTIQPDLTFVFDIEARKGLARIRRAKDRIEQRDMTYHERVREGYLQIARNEPRRVRVLDARLSREELQQKVQEFAEKILESR